MRARDVDQLMGFDGYNTMMERPTQMTRSMDRNEGRAGWGVPKDPEWVLWREGVGIRVWEGGLDCFEIIGLTE